MMSVAGKIRAAAAAATAIVALALPIGAAGAATPAPVSGSALEAPPAFTAPSGGPVEQGATLAPPATETPSVPSGGVSVEPGGEDADPETAAPEGSDGALPAPDPSTLTIPSLPASSCAATGVPPVLVPIYRRAAATYGLGPQGPAVLAGINEVETAFGTNLNISSAGAIGWMQFMPSSWDAYGVDANGDGVEDPYNPEDAIFAAASYLSAAGMPANTYDAIFAYNHADWYVSEVLANAGCYAKEVGGPSLDTASLKPQIQVFECTAAPAWKGQVPKPYMTSFENAAARYDLGKRGVWALAAVAHLESNFGKGMSKEQMRTEGPLGLDSFEWEEFGVDGNEDGRIRRASSGDSAATLARMIWSRGGLEAGLFTHNQAEWYVQEVLEEADRIEGKCKVSYIDWALAPLGNGFETEGPSAVLLGSLATAPRSAPPAVKAAIAAANSISTTPYVWGGGHSSWYSYGYDCSGAVSFALYGAGLLDRPLVSGELESYGEPGPGKWITIYASPTHTYAVIAGLRWDTVGNENGSGPRWHNEPPYPEGFVVRHPTGY
jgi:soluble lytic murein transglycosylase-like protein